MCNSCNKLEGVTVHGVNSSFSGNLSGNFDFPWERWWFDNITKDEDKDEDEFLEPERVIFSGVHTHVFWNDGTKTSVTWGGADGEDYDPEHAVAMCIAHKVLGSKSKFKKFVAAGKFQLNKQDRKDIKDAKKTARLAGGEKSAEDEFPF
jgi:hypothetical protein